MSELETQAPERLPVFVYGTLRSNQPNWDWCLRNKTTSVRTAILPGGQMHDSGGFPYVIASDNPEHAIVGELMEIKDALYERVSANLDGLEGFRGEGSRHNHYDKKVVTVVTEDGVEHRAHTYLVPEHRIEMVRERCAHIESGDWLVHEAARPVEASLFMR